MKKYKLILASILFGLLSATLIAVLAFSPFSVVWLINQSGYEVDYNIQSWLSVVIFVAACMTLTNKLK